MRRLQRAGGWLAWLAARPWLWLIERLPERAAFAFARLVGRLAYLVLVVDRRWTLWNLELVFGEQLDERGRRRLARAMFEHHARTFCEILRITPRWVHEHVIVEGMEHAWPLLESGTGVIVLSGHLGNWELLSALSSQYGVDHVMVSRPLDNPLFERFLSRCRARYLSRPRSKNLGGIRACLRDLARGQWVGLAVDLNMIRDGVFVDFLGVLAATPQGTAAMALRAGAPVVLLVTHRLPDGRHRLVLSPPLHLVRTGDDAADIAQNLERFGRALEPWILAYPEQYHWQNRRWRTRPDGAAATPRTPVEQLAKDRRRPPLVPPEHYRLVPCATRTKAA